MVGRMATRRMNLEVDGVAIEVDIPPVSASGQWRTDVPSGSNRRLLILCAEDDMTVGDDDPPKLFWFVEWATFVDAESGWEFADTVGVLQAWWDGEVPDDFDLDKYNTLEARKRAGLVKDAPGQAQLFGEAV